MYPPLIWPNVEICLCLPKSLYPGQLHFVQCTLHPKLCGHVKKCLCKIMSIFLSWPLLFCLRSELRTKSRLRIRITDQDNFGHDFFLQSVHWIITLYKYMVSLGPSLSYHKRNYSDYQVISRRIHFRRRKKENE